LSSDTPCSLYDDIGLKAWVKDDFDNWAKDSFDYTLDLNEPLSYDPELDKLLIGVDTLSYAGLMPGSILLIYENTNFMMLHTIRQIVLLQRILKCN